MCGRFFISEDDKAEEMQRIIDMLNRKALEGSALKTSGEIFPTDTVPVIANNKNLKPMPFAMEWGYMASDGRRLINARSETASKKPTFRDSVLRRRCIIPASHYFEWEHHGKRKTKYAIRPVSNDPMYMAGIYRREGDRFVFTILTREPAENIAFIHDRMPVILPYAAKDDWLNPKYKADDIIKTAVTDVMYTPENPDLLTMYQ